MKKNHKFSLAIVVNLLCVIVFFHLSPISAAEFENIDSFDVHPDSGRWDVTNAGIGSVTVDDSTLIMVDTGDGTTDTITLERGLRAFDGSVTYRFWVDSSGTGVTDSLRLGLSSGSDTLYLDVRPISSDSVGAVIIYEDHLGGTESKSLGADKLAPETWYILRIDYDLFQSEIRLRLYFDNQTRVSSHHWYDVNAQDYPALFGKTEINAYIHMKTWASAVTTTTKIDYVNAPFKEREWKHTTVAGDADWTVDETFEAVEFQDTIAAEYNMWQLNVPYLDLVSGMLRVSLDDHAVLDNLDGAHMEVNVYCVDANDGDLHNAFAATIDIYRSGANFYNALSVKIDSVTVESEIRNDANIDDLWLSFALATREDRSIYGVHVYWGWDVTDQTASENFVYDHPVASVADSPSQEWVIEFEYYVNMAADTEGKMWVESFQEIHRESMREMNIQDAIDKQPDHYYSNAWNPFEGIQRALDEFIMALGNILANAWNGIIQPIITILQTFISDLFDFLFSLASDVLEFMIDVAFYWWDAANAPDVLAWLEWGLIGITQAASGGLVWIQSAVDQLQNIWDLGSIIGVLFFFALPLFASPTIGLYLERMFHYMAFDVTFGFSPLNIIPQVPAVALWLIIMQFNILDGTAFAGFLTW
jgi:hypothetical protein